MLISLAVTYFTSPGDLVLQFKASSFIPLFFISLVLIPFQTSFEEITFRGYLMQGIATNTHSRIWALVITSLIFGLLHSFNPEVKEYGFLATMPQYIGFGVIFGLMALCSILFIIIWRIFRISRRVDNPIYHLFTLGVALMIIIAFLINSYGISGMIPIKGIAVPFLSYGGSSMLSTAIAIGLVLSISREIRNEEDSIKKVNNK
jgi:hypothetical protein